MLHKSTYDWQYKTKSQDHACKGLENNASSWPMGKIFGGSGRLNNMMYTRGHKSDFKSWYKNFPDYNFMTDILDFFKKSENQIGSFVNETQYHSTNGPLAANDLVIVSEFSEAIIKAAKLLGFPIRDVNGKFNSGFSQPQANLKDGSRYTTAHHLLQKKKSNLIIITSATVEKVLFKSNFEAYAVKFRNLGEKYVIKARKGIILSAGVIGTPKILMLSGVGVKEHLDDIGIKTKINLPVGNNLQDHVSTGFGLITLDHPLSLNFFRLCSPLSAYEYFFQSRGPLTSIGCESLAILSSHCLNSAKNKSYDSCETNLKESPDLQLIFMPVAVTSDFGIHMRSIVSIKDTVWNKYFVKLTDRNAVNILPIALHPKSRGTVRLRDKNPSSNPIIDPKYLTHPYDVEILLNGIKLVRQIVNTKPMQKLGAQLNENKFPGCEQYVFDTKNYWECYIRHMTLTLYHPVGTCKMGHEKEEETVVNFDFKLVGTNKLYIADGSVIPSLVSANTNAAIVMIGEKVASSVKYYKYLEENTCNLSELFVHKNIC